MAEATTLSPTFVGLVFRFRSFASSLNRFLSVLEAGRIGKVPGAIVKQESMFKPSPWYAKCWNLRPPGRGRRSSFPVFSRLIRQGLLKFRLTRKRVKHKTIVVIFRCQRKVQTHHVMTTFGLHESFLTRLEQMFSCSVW